MNKKELKAIKQKLLEQKMEILDKLMNKNRDYVDNLKNEIGDLADEAYEVIERELAYDLSMAEKTVLDDINDALKKIENGTYGICEDCGAPIPPERLKAKPYAKYCIKCKEKHEIRNSFKPKDMLL